MRRRFLTLITITVLVNSLLACASQQAGVQPGAAAQPKEIKEIIISEWCCDISTMKKGTQITIVGTRPLSHREHRTSKPNRLVVQFQDVGLGSLRRPMPIYEGILTEIVPEEKKGSKWTAELQIGLAQPVDYNIREEGNRLIINFKDMHIPRPSNVSQGTGTSPSVPSVKSEPEMKNTPLHLKGPDDQMSDYVIGPEDVLEILVWKNTELSKVVTVRPDGNISLPLIGDVQAAGLSPMALRDEIVKRLSEYKEVPEVSVIVQQVNSYSIYILGEVARPGRYQLKSHVTLLQAISLAGGFTPFASRNDIKVLRKEYGEAQEQTFKIRYKDIVSKGDAAQNILLRPGDTIIVP